MAPKQNSTVSNPTTVQSLWYAEVMGHYFNQILPQAGGQCRFCQLFLGPIYLPHYAKYFVEIGETESEKGETRNEKIAMHQRRLLTEYTLPKSDEAGAASQAERLRTAAEKFTNSYHGSTRRYLGKNENFMTPDRYLSAFLCAGESAEAMLEVHRIITEYYGAVLGYIYENDLEQLAERAEVFFGQNYGGIDIPQPYQKGVKKAAWILCSALTVSSLKHVKQSAKYSAVSELFSGLSGRQMAPCMAPTVKLSLETIELTDLCLAALRSKDFEAVIKTIVVCVEEMEKAGGGTLPQVSALIMELQRVITEKISYIGSMLQKEPSKLQSMMERVEELNVLQGKLAEIISKNRLLDDEPALVGTSFLG